MFVIIAVIFTIALTLYVFVARVLPKTASIPENANKVHVATSFYPLYFFATKIGGDHADVASITPPGVEPHDYEPTTSDIAKIEKSDIVILNGGSLEPWGARIQDDLKDKNVVVEVAGSKLVNEGDPHVWLDPLLAKKEMETILTAFEKADPKNLLYYASNTKSLEQKLDALDLDFQQGLKTCQRRDFITSHAAFGYLATRYNLKQTAISGISPDEEPSPADMARIATFAKENNVKYIFFETLLSPRLSETIASEIGAQTLVLNPLEGLSKEEIAQGIDYLSIQRENLGNLKIALSCQ